MCGICGVICFGGRTLNTDKLKSMCDVIAHRGPDDAGYFVARTHQKSMNFATFTDDKFQHINRHLSAIDSKQGLDELNKQSWDIFLGHRRLSILDITSAGHQPMSDVSQKIWVTYNGEIYNFKEIREELMQLGYQFKS